VVVVLVDKFTDTSTSMLLQMSQLTLNPESSESQEVLTNTSTSSLSKLHLNHLPNKLKSFFQNKINIEIWSMFFSRRVDLPQMSGFDDQLHLHLPSQKFISSDMLELVELVVVRKRLLACL
jgi:hypothetical protein